ncbi:hypothetical protein ES703_50937 [subsurface metagenome]
MKEIKCPNCFYTEFLAETNWVYTQEIMGKGSYPEFGEIIKSKTVTIKVICVKCKKKVPKEIFKHWGLEPVSKMTIKTKKPYQNREQKHAKKKGVTG